jgi:hypothetical protein
MNLLSLDELRELPDASDGYAGVYFLWLGSDLQYIGQSRHIANRLNQHEWNRLYGAMRGRSVPQINFDRATMIQLDDRPYMESDEERALYKLLIETEGAYVNAYRTPFNTWPHQPTNIELGRAGLVPCSTK